MVNKSFIQTGYGADTGIARTREFTGRTIVVCPDVKHQPHRRDSTLRLNEAIGLAEAIHLNIIVSEIVGVSTIKPATYIGSGAIEKIKEWVIAEQIDVVIVDCNLSPVQQRNLEMAVNAKVIDRTALILEIFGARARTREGKIQVELASYTFQRSRLVRAWTHLERQRGGGGFTGGPGERQIELDRRKIDERITKLKKELKEVQRTRALHRKARERVPYPVVALVGYTNAGKSTLFNRLTKAGVLAQDMLFATLDTTMRELAVGDRQRVILSDTVGFISDLPTQLVAAFRATLEEVVGADIIIHVRDAANSESDEQRAAVAHVMNELGINIDHDERIIEVMNKIDLVDDAAENKPFIAPTHIAVSAITGQGIDLLKQRIASMAAAIPNYAIQNKTNSF